MQGERFHVSVEPLVILAAREPDFAPIAKKYGIDPAIVAAIEAQETGSVPTTVGGQPTLDGYNSPGSGNPTGYGPIQWTPRPGQAYPDSTCDYGNPDLGNEQITINCAIEYSLTYAMSFEPSLGEMFAIYNGGSRAYRNHSILSKTDWPGNQVLDYFQSALKVVSYVQQMLKDCQ